MSKRQGLPDHLERPPAKRYLAAKNPHTKDDGIVFDEEPHDYYVDWDNTGTFSKDGITSTTTFLAQFLNGFNADKSIDNMMASPKWPKSAVSRENYSEWHNINVRLPGPRRITNPKSKYFGMTRKEIKAQWEANRDKAASYGTEIHAKIESFYNQENRDQIEALLLEKPFRMFMNYHRQHQLTSAPYRSEMFIWDPETKITGSIDMLYVHSTKKMRCRVTGEMVDTLCFSLVDWKVSSRVETFPRQTHKTYIDPNTYTGRARQYGSVCRKPGDPLLNEKGKKIRYGDGKYVRLPAKCKGPCKGLLDCKFTKYALQANVYKYILEKCYRNFNYGGKEYAQCYVDNMSIVVIHPNQEEYIRMEISDMQMIVKDIMEFRKKQMTGEVPQEVEGYVNHEYRFLMLTYFRFFDPDNVFIGDTNQVVPDAVDGFTNFLRHSGVAPQEESVRECLGLLRRTDWRKCDLEEIRGTDTEMSSTSHTPPSKQGQE